MTPKLIGITGNIGCGKTYVSTLFKQYGIPVFDSDTQAKLLYYTDSIKTPMTERFGEELFLDGVLNKTYLAQKIFHDADNLAFVEKLLYPTLNKVFVSWASQQETPYVLYESAIIFEKSLVSLFDAIILVTASEHVRMQRIAQRDGIAEEQIRAKMNLQWPQEDKIALSDYIIIHEKNDETDYLMQQIAEIDRKIRNR